MSTVKTNNVQIGQSVTATNNFTWYQPATPDGTVRLGNGNSGSVTDLVTLTSAGNVGIGTSSPTTKLHVSGTGSTPTLFERTGSNGVYLQLKDASGSSVFLGASNGVFAIQTPGSSYSDKLVVDSSGNLGLGVTPKAWNSGLRAIQVGYSASIDSPTGAAYARWSNNAFVDSTGGFKYINTAVAQVYEQDNSGKHVWYTAPSGTAGNAISFTQAMTLDASGTLFVGQTTNPSTATVVIKVPTGTGNGVNAQITSNTGTSYPWSNYNASGTYVGGISCTSSATSFPTSSDQRLKTNITPAGSAIQSILDFPVDQFDWIESGEHQDFGAVAQKAINVIPEMVSVPENKDEMWGIDWSKAVPRLIKTIQELHEEIQTLKAKVNA